MIAKKRGTCNTVFEVMESRTGLPTTSLLNPVEAPYIHNEEQAAHFITEMCKSGKKVSIYADYDLDGVGAATEMYRMLVNGLGVLSENIVVRFPSRARTGYGLQTLAVEELLAEGCEVLITVDNGISAYDAIKRAKDGGMHVLIIDHHPLTGDKLPPADVIVDPNADGGKSEYKDYCAAGLVYSLARRMGFGNLRGLREMAGCATISDVMSLIGANRVLVRNALDLMNNQKSELCIGMLTLMEHAGLNLVTEKDIGFKIGPIVNAADRMDLGAPASPAELPFKLFSEDIRNDALAQRLIENNESRKEVSERILKLVDKNISEECLFGDNPLFVVFEGEDAKIATPGMVGIAAGRLTEDKHVSVFVSSVAEDGLAHGSGRAYGNADIKAALDSVSDMLVRYGGYMQAAGITFDPAKTYELREALKEALADTESETSDVLYYDLEIDATQIEDTIKELEQFRPFGQGCPAPVFRVKGFRLEPKYGKFFEIKGASGSTVKLYGPNGVSAISFTLADRYQDEGSPKNLVLYGELTRNEYIGYRGLVSESQVEFIDFEKEHNKTNSNLRNLLLSKLGM